MPDPVRNRFCVRIHPAFPRSQSGRYRFFSRHLSGCENAPAPESVLLWQCHPGDTDSDKPGSIQKPFYFSLPILSFHAAFRQPQTHFSPPYPASIHPADGNSPPALLHAHPRLCGLTHALPPENRPCAPAPFPACPVSYFPCCPASASRHTVCLHIV